MRARAQSARGLLVPRRHMYFPRDKTGLTMGKPEVNLTFIPSLIHDRFAYSLKRKIFTHNLTISIIQNFIKSLLPYELFFQT